MIREAVRHLPQHGPHRNQADVDLAIKVYSRGQASRVTAIVRSVMRDEALTDRNKTDRLIELVDELGLSAAETKAKRFPSPLASATCAKPTSRSGSTPESPWGPELVQGI